MKNTNIAISMRNIRQRPVKATHSSVAPESMVESIRQSMRIEGYNIPAKVARKFIERALTK